MEPAESVERVAALAAALSATCADFGARQIEVVAAMSMMLGHAIDEGELGLSPSIEAAVVEFVRALWGKASVPMRH